MDDVKIMVEAVVALIKCGEQDLATKLCENFVPGKRFEIDETKFQKPTISRTKMESLVANINLEEVIGKTIELEEATFLRGECPFCDDPGDSFVVMMHHYCCDRCGAFGNGIQFRMQKELIPFRDAYKELYEEYGDN